MNKREIKEYIIKLIIAIILIMITALIILCLVYSKSIINYIKSIIDILIPFIYGSCIAYLLTPLCNKLKYKVINKNSKYADFISIMLTEVIFIIILTVVCITIIPQSFISIKNIIASLPEATTNIQNWIDTILIKHPLLKDTLGDLLIDIESTITNIIKSEIIPNIESIFTSIISSATSVIKITINVIVGFFVNIFILANRVNFSEYMKKLILAIFGEKISNLILEEIMVANRMFSGFFFGKIVDSTIIGVICFIVLAILNMPYALLVSVIVAITNIIPIIGPFIGAVPGVIIIFSVSPIKSLYFLIFILLLQQLDGNYIGPKCIGNATNLSTFWILFAIMFFGGLWGIIGMLIGVPLLAVIFDVINKLIDKLLYARENKTKEKYEIK